MTDQTSCPVCGTQVDPQSSPSDTYDGKTYYFCGSACLVAFQQEPQSYVAQQDL